MCVYSEILGIYFIRIIILKIRRVIIEVFVSVGFPYQAT